MSAQVYELPGGRLATDCPNCGQAVRVEKRGNRFTFHCYGGCPDHELTASLSPAVMLELAGEPTDDWLEGTPMDPAAVPAEPVPALPGFPFLVPGASAMCSGPTGSGRSALAQACAYDAALAGLRVAYLGSEVGEEEFNARAADIAKRRGDTVDAGLRERLASVRWLDLASVVARAEKQPDEWASEAADRFDVVELDPVAVAASTLNVDFDKSNADYVRFHDRVVQPLVDRGVSVLVLDNIGHATEARTRAKGASAKQDRADIALSCSLRSNPTALAITARKVRSVRAPFSRGDTWLFDRETQQITRQDEPTPDDIWRPTHLMERVSRLLEERGPLGRNEIRSAAGSKTEHVDDAIKALVHDQHISVEQAGQKRLHRLESPYREPGPTGTQPGPGPGQATGTHRDLTPVGRGPVLVPVPDAGAYGQPGPDDAQAELDRLTLKFSGDQEPAA